MLESERAGYPAIGTIAFDIAAAVYDEATAKKTSSGNKNKTSKRKKKRQKEKEKRSERER